MKDHFLLLYCPLIMTCVLHMFIVKYDLLSGVKKPIRTNLFGKNKTYRGFLVVTLLNGVISEFFFKESFLLGLALGFTYTIFELPNSFFKRLVGIEPGGSPKSNKLLFLIFDKSDSTFGVSLVYSIIKRLEPIAFLQLFMGAFIIHLSLSILLEKLRVKESI